ncbi:hypothetical protein AB0A74_14645 [Saccharothrix sp. NPDC042600]|uniref:hypothetical protein n=1 Tax=Saccharothrix TaxID=2071 RepID=UPI0033C95677|nr:NACHT domain-containing protein [Saccharothrix mutabilis subsp. capreolus]
MLETADQVASVAGFVVAAIGLVIALRRRGPVSTAQRLDRLAEVVAAQWRDEVEVRGIATAWTDVVVPEHRRLVIVGPAGAGKTVAAIRVVRDSLARRGPGGPVAVLFSLHSWNPFKDHPHRWMAAELARDYGISPAVALELVRARQIVPVLDGLDEVSDPVAALRALERVHDPTGLDPLVLTSRDRVVLTGAEVVELGPPRVEGWEGVSSPLLLWLAMASGTEPAELAGLPEAEVERRLLDRFVGAAYPDTPPPDGRRRWRAGRVERWLRFLARQEDIAWWRLVRTVPRTAIALVSALVVGPVVYAGLVLWLPGDTGLALLIALSNAFVVAMLGFWRPYPDVQGLHSGLRLHAWSALGGFGFGFLLGWAVSPIAAVAVGTVSGVLWGAVGRIHDSAPPRTAGPLSVLRADLAVTVLGSLPIPALLATLVAFAVSPWKAPVAFSAFWLFYGVVWLTGTAWTRFALARLWLAARGRTPLRLMTFLADAHRRGVLRRTGPTYEFRHARLRDHLAR